MSIRRIATIAYHFAQRARERQYLDEDDRVHLGAVLSVCRRPCAADRYGHGGDCAQPQEPRPCRYHRGCTFSEIHPRQSATFSTACHPLHLRWSPTCTYRRDYRARLSLSADFRGGEISQPFWPLMGAFPRENGDSRSLEVDYFSGSQDHSVQSFAHLSAARLWRGGTVRRPGFRGLFCLRRPPNWPWSPVRKRYTFGPSVAKIQSTLGRLAREDDPSRNHLDREPASIPWFDDLPVAFAFL